MAPALHVRKAWLGNGWLTIQITSEAPNASRIWGLVATRANTWITPLAVSVLLLNLAQSRPEIAF
ncbi:hypothetical protein D3C85_1622410 [compost metagenome]